MQTEKNHDQREKEEVEVSEELNGRRKLSRLIHSPHAEVNTQNKGVLAQLEPNWNT